MGLIGLLVVLIVSTVLIVIAITVILSVRRQTKGISKDYAEEIALRRFRNGRTIGARFAKEKRMWIWEFDILVGADVNRIWVDARTAGVIKAQNLKSGKPCLQSADKMLGKRIG